MNLFAHIESGARQRHALHLPDTRPEAVLNRPLPARLCRARAVGEA